MKTYEKEQATLRLLAKSKKSTFRPLVTIKKHQPHV